MRKKVQNLFLTFCVCSVALVGCVTANPEHETNPQAPAFVPDTGSISNAAFVAKNVNAVIPHPWQMPVNVGIDTAAALALGISTLVAMFKNRSKGKIIDAVTTVVEGASNAAELKAKVKELTTIAGVEGELNKRLNS